MALNDRIAAPGPKKILACDGGGILGLMSVEILARLEADLRAARNAPELVLADEFDLVCGTSTGAVIATCISAGMSTARIRDFYVGSGRQMFDKASIFKRLRYSYNDEPLARKLREELNAALGHPKAEPWATLGDPGLRTVLMMVLRNHSTDSPWPVWNNPRALYNLRVKDDGSPRLNCNLDLPLWQVVRASTAAPTFFPPEVVTLAEGTAQEQSFIFVDGGVTTYNNPAFLAFQMATAAPYRLDWRTGTDQLLIVSVGTGSAARAQPQLQATEMNLLHHAKNVPSALMNAASAGWDMACRLLGDCRFGGEIDREFGAMIRPDAAAANFSGPKLFTYVRYDPDVSQKGLNALGLADIEAANVQVMDSVDHIDDIQRVGKAYAEKNVRRHHLGPFG
jgi:patatin-like phospholipase/acyl hydrolase